MKIYSAHGSGGYGQKVTSGEVLLADDDQAESQGCLRPHGESLNHFGKGSSQELFQRFRVGS